MYVRMYVFMRVLYKTGLLIKVWMIVNAPSPPTLWGSYKFETKVSYTIIPLREMTRKININNRLSNI